MAEPDPKSQSSNAIHSGLQTLNDEKIVPTYSSEVSPLIGLKFNKPKVSMTTTNWSTIDLVLLNNQWDDKDGFDGIVYFI